MKTIQTVIAYSYFYYVSVFSGNQFLLIIFANAEIRLTVAVCLLANRHHGNVLKDMRISHADHVAKLSNSGPWFF